MDQWYLHMSQRQQRYLLNMTSNMIFLLVSKTLHRQTTLLWVYSGHCSKSSHQPTGQMYIASLSSHEDGNCGGFAVNGQFEIDMQYIENIIGAV